LNVPFQTLRDDLAHQKLIAVINDRLRYFEEHGYQNLLNRMFDLLAPKPKPGGEEQTPNQVNEPRPEYIAARKLRVPFDKALLTSEDDVDQYLEKLRAVLMAQVNAGKRVQI
jgi:hypothetical protein